MCEDGLGWTYPEGEAEYSERVAEKLRKRLGTGLSYGRNSTVFPTVEDFGEEDLGLNISADGAVITKIN